MFFLIFIIIWLLWGITVTHPCYKVPRNPYPILSYYLNHLRHTPALNPLKLVYSKLCMYNLGTPFLSTYQIDVISTPKFFTKLQFQVSHPPPSPGGDQLKGFWRPVEMESLLDDSQQRAIIRANHNLVPRGKRNYTTVFVATLVLLSHYSYKKNKELVSCTTT